MGPDIVIWYLVFVFSTTCHEAAHAFAAHRGGDPTAYLGGHVSLDPLPHIRRSPFGMVIVPVISFIQMNWMIGWASVPFDPLWGQRYPRRQALMSLAGPLANLSLAVVAFIVMRVLLAADVLIPPEQASFEQLVAAPGGAEHSLLGALAMGLSVMLFLNVLLGLFNLMPVPPLDGGGIVEGIAPARIRELYSQVRSNPWLQLGGLILAWQLFARIAQPLLPLLLSALHPDVRYG